MQITDLPPKELDLVAVVLWIVKMGIINSVNGENLVMMFTMSIIMKRNVTVKLHFSKSFFCFCFKLPGYTLTKASVLNKSNLANTTQYSTNQLHYLDTVLVMSPGKSLLLVKKYVILLVIEICS